MNGISHLKSRMTMHSEKSKKILFTVCEEPNSRQAFDYYATKIHERSNPIVLMNVVVPSFSFADGRIPPLYHEDKQSGGVTQEKLKKTEDLLDGYLERCKELKLRCTKETVILKHNKVSDEISSYAKGKFDLIVMSGGKHSTFERIFLGSTTLNTIQKSSVPVMVIPNLSKTTQQS
ncbi:hypothetical protein RF11_01625 [Thelohanellus kitauei]|uniref:UspA domain-containing protein n=1 Tax=Thelohanellus kitauei TaxID=669202 RepID=A0A0C2N8E2_THEKT|nr:hypothetical protein RF11_01625 [Thelohanellus kitauei]